MMTEPRGSSPLLSAIGAAKPSRAEPAAPAHERCARAVRSALVVLMLLVTLFGTGAVVVLLMFALSPLYRVSKPLWYRVDNALWGWPMWGICLFFTEGLGGMRVDYQGDGPLLGEPLLVLSNHVSELDWIIILGLAARCDAMAGVRFIAKATLAKIPILGQGLYLHHTVLIRSRPEGRGKHTTAAERVATVAADVADIETTARTLTSEHAFAPVWLAIFPEGTRITVEQHAKATSFAEEKGLTPYRYLLQPRAKGLESVLGGARPAVARALDLTLAYEGHAAECELNRTKTPGILDALRAEPAAPVRVRVLIQQVALPEEGEDVHAWLQGRWAAKERELAFWQREGRFDAQPIELPLSPKHLIVPALAAGAWAALLCWWLSSPILLALF